MSAAESATGTAAVVLAAGMGTRMKSALPKVLHPVAGRPMVLHVLDRLAEAGVSRTVVVVPPGASAVGETVRPAETAVQDPPLGTGHAVLAARDHLEGLTGPVLVLFGDTPLLTRDTVERMIAALSGDPAPAVAVLGFRPDDPGAYGRLVTNGSGALERIVEYRDATEAEREINLCNAGIMAIAGEHLLPLLDAVGNDNAKGEYYLTDIIAIARDRGLGCVAAETDDEHEVMGVNSRVELAVAERVMQDRLRQVAMENGATLTDPSTTYFSWDTELGQDVLVGPNVVFGPNVTVGDNVEIRAFCHFEGAAVADGAVIGPFARLRPGADIGEEAHIGNFVEIKAADVETGAKVNHLTYIGDARVGAGANVGAGTITCNYDGFFKTKTDIGANAFIGSNSALVAPVKIGDGAIVGAGSVITVDVKPGALAVERSEQAVLDDWATKFRERRKAEKEASKADPPSETTE